MMRQGKHNLITDIEGLNVGHGNTTLAIVATDACLDKATCRRLAITANDTMPTAQGLIGRN